VKMIEIPDGWRGTTTGIEREGERIELGEDGLWRANGRGSGYRALGDAVRRCEQRIRERKEQDAMAKVVEKTTSWYEALGEMMTTLDKLDPDDQVLALRMCVAAYVESDEEHIDGLKIPPGAKPRAKR